MGYFDDIPDAAGGTAVATASTAAPPDYFADIPHEKQQDYFSDIPASAQPNEANLLDLFAYKVAHNGTTAVQGLFKGLSAIASDEQKRQVLKGAIDGLEKYKTETLPKYYNVSSTDEKSTAGKVIGAAASVSDIAAGPALMISKLAGQTYSDGYDQSVQQQHAAGETDSEKIRKQAEKDASWQVGKMAPVLALYAAGGKVAGMAADAVLPEAAGPLSRFMVGGGAAAGANLTASGLVRKTEGKPFTGDLEQNLTDIFFGGTGGLHDAFRPPKMRISDIQVPKPGDGEPAVPRAASDAPVADINVNPDFARYQGPEVQVPEAAATTASDNIPAAPVDTHAPAETVAGEVTAPLTTQEEQSQSSPEDTSTTTTPQTFSQPNESSAAAVSQPSTLNPQPPLQDPTAMAAANAEGLTAIRDSAAVAQPASETPTSPENTQPQEPLRTQPQTSTSVSQPDHVIPSTEWQEVPQGAVLPNGGEYKFDQSTGKNFARWDAPAVEATAVKEAATTPQIPQAFHLRKRAGEGGFLNADLLQGAADIGRRVYTAGMDFVRWGAHMVRQLGEKIRPHLESIWNSITGQNILPHAQERGGAHRGLSQDAIEGAANDGQKMREHITTTQRMTDVSPDVKARVESWYSAVTLPEVNGRATATIDKMGLGAATDAFMRSRTTDANTMALGHHVSLRLDALGRYDEAAMVRDGMASRLTSPAQSLWYISTISKTSPEGLVREAQRIVADEVKRDPEKVKLLADIQRLQKQLEEFQSGSKGQTAATNIALRQLGQVNKRGQRLSAAQIDRLVQRNNDGLLTPNEFADTIAKHLGIPKLTPENISKIKAAQRIYAQAEASGDPIMRLRRAADMMDSVYGLVPKTFWDKVRATATISMILHGRLPIRIGASNIMQMVGQTAVDAVNAVTLDPLISVFTGKRTVTGPELKARLSGLGAPMEAFRSGQSDAVTRGLGTVKSFREGVRTMLDMSTMTTRGIMDVNEMRGATHTFSSRFGRLAEDTVTLLHNTIPYAFWNSAHRASLVRQMRIGGVDVPTAEMIENARMDANKAIFVNETVVYKMLKGIRGVLDMPTNKVTGGKYGVGTATVPFAKVPGAILTEGATWTPLGFIRAGWEVMRGPITKEPFRQKEFADAFTKAVAGTGALVATGYWLAKLGVLTGAPDENQDVEAMRRSTGWGAYRINVSELKRRMLTMNFHTPMREGPQDGDLTLSYNWIEPAAFPLAMGADIAHSHDKREIDLKRGKITSNAVVASAMAGVGTLLTHPMLQGVESFARDIGAKDTGRAFTGLAANVPGNFIPSLVRQTSQYIDNTVRETRGGTLVDQTTNRIEAQLPWLSRKYPARYDVFGQAVQRYNYGDNSLINIFFNPAQPNRIRSNPAVTEMEKLFGDTGSTRALPKQVDKSIVVNGRQVQLDNQQLATYQRYVGQQSSALITRVLASPAFAAEPSVIKQGIIGQLLEAVHTAAKIDLFGQRPVSVSAGGLNGPTVHGPSAFDLAAIMQGRRMKLTTPAVGGP